MKEIEGEKFKEILQLISKLSRFSEIIRRNGGDFEDYLSESEGQKLPEYLVNIREGNEEFMRYLINEDALVAFSKENPDLKLVAGLRYDHIDLTRDTFATATVPASRYAKRYEPLTGRAGVVWSASDALNL